FSEALAAGLPIVACRAGAVPETVPAEAGLLVDPDDLAAFAGALRTLLSDPEARAVRAAAAARFGAKLPSWTDTARIVAENLAHLARHRGPRSHL
ncbi:MAG: glycosyltransferase family 4 protein, partial [Pseudomonadota bacterium]